jgi:hypothetical protein
MSLKRKVDDLKPFSDPQGCVRQTRERGLQVETHAHQLEKIKAVEVHVPEKELAVMFVERQACRDSPEMTWLDQRGATSGPR